MRLLDFVSFGTFVALDRPFAACDYSNWPTFCTPARAAFGGKSVFYFCPLERCRPELRTWRTRPKFRLAGSPSLSKRAYITSAPGAPLLVIPSHHILAFVGAIAVAFYQIIADRVAHSGIGRRVVCLGQSQHGLGVCACPQTGRLARGRF